VHALKFFSCTQFFDTLIGHKNILFLIIEVRYKFTSSALILNQNFPKIKLFVRVLIIIYDFENIVLNFKIR